MHHRKSIIISLLASLTWFLAPTAMAMGQQGQGQGAEQQEQCDQCQQKGECHIQCPKPKPRTCVEVDLGGYEIVVHKHCHTIDTKVIKETRTLHGEDWKEGQDVKVEYPQDKKEFCDLPETWQPSSDQCDKDGVEKSIMTTKKAQNESKIGEREVTKLAHSHECVDTKVTEQNRRRTEEWEEVEERIIPAQKCADKGGQSRQN